MCQVGVGAVEADVGVGWGAGEGGGGEEGGGEEDVFAVGESLEGEEGVGGVVLGGVKRGI